MVVHFIKRLTNDLSGVYNDMITESMLTNNSLELRRRDGEMGDSIGCDSESRGLSHRAAEGGGG